MPERPKGANYEVKRPLLEVVGLKLSNLNCLKFIPIVWHEPTPSGVFDQIV